MHFEALLVLVLLASFFSALAAFFLAAVFIEAALAADLVLQFLLVQLSLIIIEPQVQNCVKYINPPPYKYITKMAFLVMSQKIYSYFTPESLNFCLK